MAISSPPQPPAQDDPEALIREARDSQRRRRLLALATVAVAVALGLGIYGAATGGGLPASASPRSTAPPRTATLISHANCWLAAPSARSAQSKARPQPISPR